MLGAVGAGGEKPRVGNIPGPTSPRAELLEVPGEEAVFWELVSQPAVSQFQFSPEHSGRPGAGGRGTGRSQAALLGGIPARLIDLFVTAVGL